MIDDKKIEEAARDYINKKNGYFVKYDEDPCVAIELAYKEGAKWAINEFLKDLWHPASEEPNDRDDKLLIEFEDCYSLTTRISLYRAVNWQYFIEKAKITRWLYLDDLL